MATTTELPATGLRRASYLLSCSVLPRDSHLQPQSSEPRLSVLLGGPVFVTPFPRTLSPCRHSKPPLPTGQGSRSSSFRQSATVSPAAPALGPAGARLHPPGLVPDSAPPLWDFPPRGRSSRVAEPPSASGARGAASCPICRPLPVPARRPSTRARVLWGPKPRRRRRRPSPLSHLTHRSADREAADREAVAGRARAGQPREEPSAAPAAASAVPGRGGRSSPLPADGRGTGTRPREALGPQPGGRPAAPGTRRTLPPACERTSFPRPLVRGAAGGGSLSQQ